MRSNEMLIKPIKDKDIIKITNSPKLSIFGCIKAMLDRKADEPEIMSLSVFQQNKNLSLLDNLAKYISQTGYVCLGALTEPQSDFKLDQALIIQLLVHLI